MERDERLGEGVRRLARRVEEGLSKMNGGEGEVGVRKVLEKFVREAKGLLDSLDGSLEGPLAQSALGRIIVAESAVKMLARELQVETEKRLRLERLAAVAVRDPWGENATEQDEEPKTPVATSDERTDTSRLWAVPGSDNAVLRSVENANGSSSSTAGDNPLDVCGDSSSGGASSSHIVQSLDQGDTSSTYTDTPRGPADCDFKPDGNLAMNEKVLSANTAAEPTDPNIPYVAESPVPDSTMVSSASSPLLSTESLTANPDYQTDVIQEGDLPPIAASLSRNLDEPHLSPAQAIVASADTLAPRFPPNLTVTVDIATNSCPPSASSPAPNVTVDLGDSVVSLPTQSVLLLKHPLLPELSSVRIRYDCLERAFRDCHLTLQDLKRYLRSPPLAAPSASSQAPPISPAIAVPVLQMAIERLDDYTEDARVELEIRAADEALLIRGFETLLSIPGALASAITPVHATSDGEDCRRPEQAEVERDIRAFVDGTDISVAKAMQLFTKKLDDIQHDIAAIKGAVYSPALDSVPHLVPGDPFTPSTSPLSSSTSWSSWTAGILGSGSRLASPAPTFGNVMTTPRLRHTLSLNFYGNGHRHDKSVDLDIDGTGDPLASLGLRVPMPAYVPVSPVRPSVRPSTLSAMYMLGLGSGGAGAPLSGVAMGSGREETDGKGVEGDDVDSGVE